MLVNEETRNLIEGGAVKLFLCFFDFEAGSDLLPVRSGAAKFDALKAISVEC
jgi:hypothetical protein